MTNGTAIVGRYRIEGRLGVGGMSTVQLAFDQRLERYVAIKLLAEHLADDPTFVSRFRREALSAARLVHPNIVQVFDFGFDEHARQHFIVMEHVVRPLVRRAAPRPRPDGRRAGGRRRDPGLPRARLRAPQRRRAPGRQAGQPARVRFRGGQARRLRDRARHRPVEHHPGRLGARDRRLPRARAGARRGGRPARRSLLARRRRLPAADRPPARTRPTRCRSSRSSSSASRRRSVDELNPRVPPELADAISMALALDQEDRPETAMLLGRGDRRRRPRRRAAPNGSRDRGTPGAPPRPACSRGAARRRPRPGSAPRTPPATGRTARPAAAARQLEAAPAGVSAADGRLRPGRGPSRAAPKRSGGSRAARRFFAFLAVVVLFVAAVAVAITIAASTSNNVVHFRKVVAHDTNDAVNQLQKHHQPVHEVSSGACPHRVTCALGLRSSRHGVGRESPGWDTHLRSHCERTAASGPLRGVRGAVRPRPARGRGALRRTVPGAAPARSAAATSGSRPPSIASRRSAISRAMNERLWSVTSRSAVSSPARSR